MRVPVQDSHGNITKVINGGSGATLFEAHYSPFGERAITNGTISSGDGSGQPFGFTGAEHDSVSELVYMRNRYYAPGLGRFISEDPIGFAGGDNFYAYCGNDPVNFTDPLGLFSTACPGTLTVGIDPDNPWLVFTGEGMSDAFATWRHGVASGITFGLYDGGAYRCTPGFKGAQILGGVAGVALVLAAYEAMTTFAPEIGAGSGGIAEEGVTAASPPTVQEYDVVNYKPSNSPLENHHGIMDAWAKNNIEGYSSYSSDSTAIALSKDNHNATRRIFMHWKFDKYGDYRAAVKWDEISPREIQELSERMFDGAGVPEEARRKYYRKFHQHIYK